MQRNGNFSKHKIQFLDSDIFYYDFGNPGESKSIYIQGQLHSNEVNTFTTLYALVEKLKLNPPPFRVRIVPSCNPIGWNLHLNGRDGRASYPGLLDWNRIFHTIPIESEIPEMSLAHKLWELSEGFSQIIDVHAPDFGFPHIYTSYINTRLNTFEDIPYVIANEKTDGSFQSLNTKQRKNQSFTLELPSAGIWTLSDQIYWVERIYKEIISVNPQERKSTPSIYGSLVTLTSRISGVPTMLVEPNKICEKNSPLVTILSSDGNQETLFYSKNCIPICFKRRGLIKAGHMIIRVLSLE